MSQVNKIRGSNPISPIRPSVPNTSTPMAGFDTTIREKIQFPGEKLKILEEEKENVIPQESEFYPILHKLFLEILECKIDIVPSQPIKLKDYAVEAFFKPPVGLGSRPSIHLPLPIQALGNKTIKAPSGVVLGRELISIIENIIEKTIKYFNIEQIVRLLIVTTHEYGHYLSFAKGNHDENLKTGLYIFQKNGSNSAKADTYTWLVFREECLAWSFAENFLKKTEFKYWEKFEVVKNHSLKTYFETLKLNNASLETYYKLSFLGENFAKNSLSELF